MAKTKEEKLTMARLYKKNHKDEIRRWRKEYYIRNRLKENIQSAIYRSNNIDKIKNNKKLQRKNNEVLMKIYDKRGSEKLHIIRLKAKIDVLTHYGNGELACVKCGFDDIRALSIDHINGGGKKHRREIRENNMYVWLCDHNYPEGFQTLCMNCQWIKRAERKEYANSMEEKVVAIKDHSMQGVLIS